MKNLDTFIKSKGLKVGDVATALWPDTMHPRHAYYHHLKSGAELTESQLIALSKLSGASIDTILEVSLNASETGYIYPFHHH